MSRRTSFDSKTRALTLSNSSDWESPTIRIYDGRGDGKPLHTIEKLHRHSVLVMTVSPLIPCKIKPLTPFSQYSPVYDCVISSDEGGFIEYWRPTEPWALPSDVRGLWQYKSQTDLFEFKKVPSTTHPPPSLHG